MRSTLIVAVMWVAVVAAVESQRPPTPPPTPAHPVVDTPASDPYGWLEDTGLVPPRAAAEGDAREGARTANRAADPIAITGVTVIDVERGERLPDRTVVITGDRITQVGRTGQIALPAGARTIDGRGRYLIPGLIDAHVHLTEEHGPFAPLYLAFGMTALRDMGGHLDSLKLLRARVDSGDEPGPRIYFAGRPIDGDPPQWPPLYPKVPVVVHTPEEARAAVRAAKAAGVDFIKLYHGLSPLLLREAVAEAHAQGLKATADLIPWAFPPESALVAGLDGLEHSVPASAGMMGWWADTARMKQVVAQLASDGTALTSTLVGIDRFRPRLSEAGATYQALPPALRERSAEMVRRSNPPEQIFDYECQTVRELVSRGGLLLAGTDSYYMAAYPGDLHRELELLVDCGLTPSQALAAGTVNPARWLGATDSLGVIAEGKIADLVLLDADPLSDIRNTQKIRAVVADGRVYDRAALDALLADPEKAAGEASPRHE